MKLLLLSDLHCNVQAAAQLVRLAANVDVVVGAGDFATQRRGLEEMINVLRPIRCPVVVVPGNSESDEELADACRDWTNAHVLHGTGVEIEGVSFFGIGGAVPVTPFGAWSFDLTEDQARALLADCPSGGVLVTHSPPYGAVDMSSLGKSLGSRAVLETLERVSPALVVCGHIHESAGKWCRIRSTDVVNAGPRGVLWELPDSRAITSQYRSG